jgi:SAM-dependent methyltransferase
LGRDSLAEDTGYSQKMTKESNHLPYAPTAVANVNHEMRVDALFTIIHSIFCRKIVDNALKKSQIKILDMACGRGELLARLKNEGYDVIGVDKDQKCVQIASRNQIQVLLGDYYNLEKLFKPNTFNLVISSHSLEHLENPREELAYLIKITNEYILLAVPNPLSMQNIFYSFFQKIGGVQPGHLYIWDHRHLRNFLEQHLNLEIISWHCDFVKIFTRRRNIRTKCHKLGMVRPVEMKLCKYLPFFGQSIIVLCKKRINGDSS